MRLALLLTLCLAAAAQAGTVLVYGGTPAGVAAAVSAARLGETVTLVEPSAHIGGVVSGGLTRTDIGRKETVGGFPREFFDRCRDYYAETYGADSPQVKASANGIYMEPSIAERIFEAMLAEAGVTVHKGLQLVAVATDVETPRIVSATVADGQGATRDFAADGYVDASYEGDLMAMAGVPYTVGRESSATYGETMAGIRIGPPESLGAGDHRVQAYNYRLCLTNNPDNRVMPEQPEGYDPAVYDRLLAFILERQPPTVDYYILNILPVPNDKYDANNSGRAWQSSDWVGHNWDYPDATPAERRDIAAAHLRYVQGLLYFLHNDPRIPEPLRADARQWGLARDEFGDNGGWPHQMYVREARRMLGAYVFSERDATEDRYKPDRIGIGSYTIDSHGCGFVRHAVSGWMIEGGLGLPVKPYEIPYRILCPPQLTNLLVPVCCSASHVGYCTLRMEPVYMMLGQASGVALHLANAGGSAAADGPGAAGAPVREVDVERLQTILRQQNALLDAPFEPIVTVRPADPAIAEAGRLPVGRPVTLRAEPERVRAPLTDYWWDLNGDGQLDATGPEVTATYDQPQTATVWLRVRDAEGGLSEFLQVPLTVGEGGPPEVWVDDSDYPLARWHGLWERASTLPHLGTYYRHDENRSEGKGVAAFRFLPPIPASGRWRVLFAVVPSDNRAGNVPITLHHADGETAATLDERLDPGVFPFADLGTYRFEAGEASAEQSILVRTEGTDAHVVVDGVRLVWVGP